MSKKKKKFDVQSFDVTVPPSASQIIGICFLCILALFFIFIIMYLFKFGGVTKGNFYVCIVIECIFLMVLLQFKTWKLSVRDDEIYVNGFYRKKERFKFNEIDEVVLGNKNELKIYAHNRKVTTIDVSCTYYDEFYELLKIKGCKISRGLKQNVR